MSRHDGALTTAISFRFDDGWCDPAEVGFGRHCFGDFQVPQLIASEAIGLNHTDYVAIRHPEQGRASYVTQYTPTAMFPHVISALFINSWLGMQGTLIFYLVVLGGCLLLPALLASVGARGPPWKLVPFIFLGVVAAPFWSSLDRGNSAAFAIPFILVFALFFDREPTWVAPTAVVMAALVRPQFLLLLVAFVALRRIKSMLSAIGAFVAATALGLALWPGGLVPNTRGWVSEITRYTGYTDPGAASPTNLSASRAITILADMLASVPGLRDVGASIRSAVHAVPVLPGLVLLVIAVAILATFGRRAPRAIVLPIALIMPVVVPGVSFIYYLFIALILGALILGPSDITALARPRDGRWRDGLLASSPNTGVLSQLWGWSLIGVVAISLLPPPLALGRLRNARVLEVIALPWLLVILVGLTAIVIYWRRDRTPRWPSQPEISYDDECELNRVREAPAGVLAGTASVIASVNDVPRTSGPSAT
ncbi:MAG: hypothetical protein WCI83_07840 [Thermoleophilia bacterium]